MSIALLGGYTGTYESHQNETLVAILEQEAANKPTRQA